MKNGNSEMILVLCMIHRENLVGKNISQTLNQVLHSAIPCINEIKTNAKNERLFKLFCELQSAEYIRLLMHTDVIWLSKENCLKIFMELFDSVAEFLNNFPK
jgi:hypothetical protein